MLRRGLILLLVLSGLACMAQGGIVQAKAVVAQFLLERAWARTAEDGIPRPPWPGADHWPVARLTLGEGGPDHIVLEGDSGAVLAFAPGRSPASGMPGSARTVVISGHRDTHFRRLDRLKPGDIVQLEWPGGGATYRVLHGEVVDSRTTRLRLDDDQRLMLVTCWPMDAAVSGGPMRYVVSAELVEVATRNA